MHNELLKEVLVRPQKKNANHQVPDILMNTWCWMMMEPGNDPYVKQHGHDALASRFDSEKDLLEWIARNESSPERYKQRASQMLKKESAH